MVAEGLERTARGERIGPVLKGKLLERGFRAPGMDHEQCGAGTGQNPKPDQFGLATPRGTDVLPTFRPFFSLLWPPPGDLLHA